MSSAIPPDFEELPVRDRRVIDRLCTQFESAWKEGTPPCLEQYLADAPASLRSALLRELLLLEVEYRGQQGTCPSPDSYASRFPEHADLVGQVCRDAVRQRGGAGPPPAVPGYEILEELGRGGMGVVYKARQVAFNRLVALKVLLDGAYVRPDAQARFRTEAETLARLQHPHIVQVHDTGTHDGRPYLVLEYVGGGSLASRCRGKPQPPREAAVLVETLARAVHHAHQQGIVHRDLKPGNVLLQTTEYTEYTEKGKDKEGREKEGREERKQERLGGARVDGSSASFSVYSVYSVVSFLPKITDFGLARRLDQEGRLTATGQAIGTPSYMAPEQAAGGREVGPAADVYALGAILYDLLTGRPPFTGVSAVETVLQVLHAEPVPPRRLQPQVPVDLETICLKCLEKDPGRRYATATALADDLGRFLRGEPVRARPVRWLGRSLRWARRNPLAAALGGGLVAVGLLGLAGVLVQWRDAVTARDEARRTGQAARLQAAELTFGRGLALAEQGEIDAGLHWMLQALREAPADAVPLQRLVRVNLAAWAEHVQGLRCLLPHDDQVTAVAFAPDGRQVATGCRDTYARRWDAATGAQLGGRLGPHPGKVMPLVFSPDSRYLLTGSEALPSGVPAKTHVVRRWDAATGAPVGKPAEQDQPFRHLLPGSPDGRLAYTLPHPSPHDLRCFDLDSGQLVRKDRVAWYPLDLGVDVASGRPWVLRRDDTTGPTLFRLLHPTDGTWQTLAPGDPAPAAWRGRRFNGKLALEWDWQAVLRIDPATGSAVGERLWLRDMVTHELFSPDGRLIAACAASGTRLWETTTGRLVANLEHHGPIVALAFDGDGERLVGGGHWASLHESGAEPVARLWDMARARSRPGPGTAPASGVTWPMGHRGQICTGAAVASDAGRVALVGGELARLWDVTGARPLPLAPEGVFRATQAAFSPDGTHLATGGRTNAITVWDLAAGQPARPSLQHSAHVNAVAYSPEGRTLAAGDFAGLVLLWDPATGQRRGEPLQHPDVVSSVAFSPDGRRLAVGTVSSSGSRSHCYLWDVATGQPIGQPLTYDAGGTVLVRSSPADGTVFAFSQTEGRLVDPATGAVRAVLGPGRGYSAAAFSSDGRLLVTGSGDGTSQVWDVAAGRRLAAHLPLQHPLRSHVTSVAFSPDAALVLTGHEDGTARLWDVATSRPLGPPVVHRHGIVAVAFRPDGQSFLTVAGDGSLRTWSVPAPLAEDLASFALRLAVRTGLELDEGPTVVPLAAAAWRERADHLRATQGSAERPLAPGLDAPAWHDARAADAEQDDDHLGALWHLDRLAPLRPDDWRVFARRGRLHLLAGRTDLAERDYERAAALDRAAVRAWYAYQAGEAAILRDGRVEAWYRARAQRP